MWICPKCRELYDQEWVDRAFKRENPHYSWLKDGTDYNEVCCPDCGEELKEAVLCPVCEEEMMAEDEETCRDCEKYTRFAEKAAIKCSDLYYSMIKMYAGKNEKALCYMRDLYEGGLV